MHKDIGKKVRWFERSESGTGTLLAVDCDTSACPHLVQRDDWEGWKLSPSDRALCHQHARKQGVEDGTPHLYWVESYEVIEPIMKTWETLGVGDKVKSPGGDIFELVAKNGRVYFFEYESIHYSIHLLTKRQFEQREWSIIQDESTTEIPFDEAVAIIAKERGVEASTIRIKE